uniref:Uncharacterized protein n=1 Tax=Tetranychus urticae TaxID=32264 RepID=T1KX81_TETUR
MHKTTKTFEMDEDNLGYTTRFKEIVKFGREKRFKLVMKSSSLSGSMEDEISFHL